MSLFSRLAKIFAGSVSFIVLLIAVLVALFSSCPCCQRTFFVTVLRLGDSTKMSNFNREIVCPHITRGLDHSSGSSGDSSKSASPPDLTVLDLGTGAGGSVGCYALPNVTRIKKLYLVEPEDMFREDLEKVVGFFKLRDRMEVEIVTAKGEDLARRVPAGSVDIVNSLHLLCSVPVAALEALVATTAALLKPGSGEWRTVDHRLATRGWVRVFQEAIAPVWSTLFNGCRIVDFVVEYPRLFPVADVTVPSALGPEGSEVKLGIASVKVFEYPVIPYLVLVHPHITGVMKRPPLAIAEAQKDKQKK